MQRKEEIKEKPAVYENRPSEGITSDSIENAHASGDGAVQKSDELLPPVEDSNQEENKNPY